MRREDEESLSFYNFWVVQGLQRIDRRLSASLQELRARRLEFPSHFKKLGTKLFGQS
jgi:hypothetical protein